MTPDPRVDETRAKRPKNRQNEVARLRFPEPSPANPSWLDLLDLPEPYFSPSLGDSTVPSAARNDPIGYIAATLGLTRGQARRFLIEITDLHKRKAVNNSTTDSFVFDPATGESKLAPNNRRAPIHNPYRAIVSQDGDFIRTDETKKTRIKRGCSLCGCHLDTFTQGCRTCSLRRRQRERVSRTRKPVKKAA